VLLHGSRQAVSWLIFDVRQKMKMQCLACGAAKDTRVPEFYPYPDDHIVSDKPIEPLFALDCQGPLLEPGDTKCDWRVVIVCHHCLHGLEPDMWISDQCWQSLNPITPFEQLPRPLHDDYPGDRFEVEAYAKGSQ